VVELGRGQRAMVKLTAADVLREVEDARYQARVLMANGDGAIKRQMGLVGDYRKHCNSAHRAIVDNAFYLTIAVYLIERSWFMSRKFKNIVKEMHKQMDMAYKPIEAEEKVAISK
jgi:hypothetical protein